MVCILGVGMRQHWLCWARVLQIPQLSHVQDLLGSPKLPMTLSPPMILSLFLRYVWQEQPVGPTLWGTPAKHWVMEVLREQGSWHTGGVG